MLVSNIWKCKPCVENARPRIAKSLERNSLKNSLETLLKNLWIPNFWKRIFAQKKGLFRSLTADI